MTRVAGPCRQLAGKAAGMSWWSYLAGPWRSAALAPDILTRLEALEARMADVSPILNKLADDLASWAAGPFAEVLAENTRLAARNAELEGEDVAESSAAQRAVDAFNAFTQPVTDAPDVPVEIPPVEVPEAPALSDTDGAGTTDLS